MLKEGIKAPNFKLKDSHGNIRELSEWKGKKIVLYFYPKDDTPGCTAQACSFRDNYSMYAEKDVVLVGISKDTVSSHLKFINKYDLPFILLSDKEKEVCSTYDVLKEKSMYGKKYMGIVRSTYIIDEDGIIIKSMDNVDPNTNALDVLKYL